MVHRRMLSLATAGAIGTLLLLLAVRRSSAQSSPSSTIEVHRARMEVRVRALAHLGRLSQFFVQPGHHAVVWEKGRARFGALFVSRASDHAVRAALLSLGAKPGENLKTAAWNERKNPRNPEPDRRVEGTPVDVFVEWAGSGGLIPLSHLILERGKAASFDFRFGGNERFRRSSNPAASSAPPPAPAARSETAIALSAMRSARRDLHRQGIAASKGWNRSNGDFQAASESVNNRTARTRICA